MFSELYILVKRILTFFLDILLKYPFVLIPFHFYAHDTPATQGKNLFIAKDQMEKAVKLLVILCDLQKANYLKSKGI